MNEETRKIDVGDVPDVPVTEKQPVKRRRPTRLPITPKLKKRASEFISALGLVDREALWEHGVSEVELKCVTARAAKKVLSKIAAFYKLGAVEKAVSFVRVPKLTTPQGKNVIVPLDQFLPNWFDELAHDVERTGLRIIEIEAKLANAAGTFVRAYDNNFVVSATPSEIKEDAQAPEKNEHFADVVTAHKTLLRFLEVIVSLASDNPPHIIIIRDDFTVEIDGEVQQLTDGQMWALCALAIFRNRRLISHKEFMLVYSNDQRELNKQDVSNVLRTLRSVIPRFDYRSDGQKRCRISNLFIESELTNQELEEILPRKDSENNYGDISLENDE